MHNNTTSNAATTTRLTRRHLLACGGWAALGGLPLNALAATGTTFPGKPVKIVVPFSAGGATDALGRLMARHLEKALGQPVIVENRPGAAGAIGAAAVARSEADGYTVLMGGVGSNIVLEHTMPGLAYKPARDFAAVAYLCNVDYVLAVAPGSPYRSVTDLLNDARARPGEVKYMSTGPLGPLHVALEYLSKLAGVKMIHAPYQGEAPALPDLMEGRLDVAQMTAATTRPLAEAGKLRILATLSAERIKTLPKVPTVAEMGFPGYAIPIWNGFFVPAGTPPAAVETLSSATLAQLKSAGMPEALDKLGMTTTAQGPVEYERFLAAERLRWTRMIQESGVLKG